MAEEATERRLDRHLFGVSPPTPTASSPGPNSTAQGSVDGVGAAAKKASLSGTSAAPPRPHSGNASASRLLCRPWDCGDFLRRLGTFRLGKWNHKPQTIGPAVCARKGWVNVDVDEINCECCEAQLCFVLQPGLSEETAAEAFRDQLETAHKQSCPWKGNSCAESRAQFPTSLMALIGGYNDRCDALLQLPALPIISSFSLDQMKVSRGPQLERALSQPPPVPGGFNLRDKAGVGESSNSNHVYYKAQRLISLCGWEARLLPHTADFEDHSAQSTRNACSIGPSRPSHKRSKRNPMVYSKAEKEGDSRISQRTRAASAVLECNYCAVNVNITSLPSAARPGLGGSWAEYVESEKKAQTLVRGASAASSIGGQPADPEQPLDGGNEATASERKTEAAGAGAVPAAAAAAARPPQPEGSEMGDCGVASYDSRREEQQGASSICMPRLKAVFSESGEHEVDEVDNADGKSSAAESSKRRRAGDNLATDQASLGMALSASATGEGDADAEVNDRKNKRVCIGLSADRIPAAERAVSMENSRDRRRGLIPVNESLRTMTRRLTSDFPCSSSVNATDTCFQNKRENSMDSVEYMPHDDAQQNTAASGYTENEWLFDEPNSVAQAQHSESYVQVHAQRGTTEDGTNAAVISTGTATAGGGSVGMVGAATSHRVQSNEADIVGADFSEHQTDSVAGEAAVVIDALEHQALSGDIGLVCDSAPPAAATQDYSDAVLSLCPGASSAKDLGADSGESGSKASQRTRNGFLEEDRTADTANAVIVGTSTATYARELAEPSVEAPDERTVANSSGTATAPRDVDERHFDPVRRHRSFCPWVNGLVLAAANGTFGSNSEAACGWQLTVDALDAFHTQDGVPAGATESESTASMCKESRLF